MCISDCKYDKIGIYAGLIFEPVFFVAVLISLIFNPWFDYNTHPLSDLGAKSATYPWIFNMGLFLTGAFGIVFSLRVLIKMKKPMNYIGYLMLIGTIFFILVGIFPDDFAFYIVPNQLSLHKFITLLGSSIISLGILSYAIYWVINKKWRRMGISLLIIGFTLPGIALLINSKSLTPIEIAFSTNILVWSYMLIYHLCHGEANESVESTCG